MELAVAGAALVLGLVIYRRSSATRIITAEQVAKRWFSGLDGKVVAITGCNSGLGKETARAILVHANPKSIVLLCRSGANAEATKRELAVLVAAKSTQIIAEACDLASLDAVDKSVPRLLAKLKGSCVDVCICNAGVATVPDYTKTVDGHELQFGVNFLGHFKLASLLMQARNAKSGGKTEDKLRFVMVSSGAYVGLKELDLDDLNCEKSPYHLFTAYSRSKLCNILHARALNTRPGVEAFAVDPGMTPALQLPQLISKLVATSSIHTRNFSFFFVS
jgi:NAD(P)-dependent dehydrogenase (short-subunit alcohol dehydrogenase family)